MKELIKQCRYYKGERECPPKVMKEGKGLYWDYERNWVENDFFRDENSGYVGEYTRYGLKDFNVDDGTPITLKAILFNRYSHWNGGSVDPAEGFKKWYIANYSREVEEQLNTELATIVEKRK